MRKYGILLSVMALCGLVMSCGGITGKSDSKFALEAARKGLWKEALFRWKIAVEEDPNNAKLHNNLAIAYENEGEYDLALKEYRIAIRLDPGNYYINNNYNSFLRFYQKLKPEEEGEEKETEKPPPGGRIQ